MTTLRLIPSVSDVGEYLGDDMDIQSSYARVSYEDSANHSRPTRVLQGYEVSLKGHG